MTKELVLVNLFISNTWMIIKQGSDPEPLLCYSIVLGIGVGVP